MKNTRIWKLLELLLEDEVKCDTKGMPKAHRMFLLDDGHPDKVKYLKDCEEKNINPDTNRPWRSEASKSYEGKGSPDFKTLKKHKKPLSEEERKLILKEKAVWHHGPNGEESCAVFKSVLPNGKTYYTTNTHRAYNTSTDLSLTIDRFHDFIKDTA